MFIVINCLGMPFNGDTVKTKSLGGSESAAYYMAKELAKNHKVTIFTNSQEGGEFDGVRYVFAGEQNQDNPLGEFFHFYAENTPHDVLIIQRHPLAFTRRYASKVNLWWLHDLALKKEAPIVHSMLWNIDGIITVSQYHKDQIVKTWGISPEIVRPVINAVDSDLFNVEVEKEDKTLIYISRPERGLEHLVKQGGIMERLPDWKLYVCGYDNTVPAMRDYYQYLWSRCDALDNVVNLGALTKADLAKKMKSVSALIYPTPGHVSPDFREVSCIAVMEAMHAGVGIITSDAGALPETLSLSGATLIPLKDGMPDSDKFVDAVNSLSIQDHSKGASHYVWETSANQLMNFAKSLFSEITKNVTDIARHLIDYSDIKAYEKLISSQNAITDYCRREYAECYSFSVNNTFKKHYEDYYQYEKDRGANYGPENLSNNLRFNHIAGLISNIPDCRVVGDYGCAHGHYTINLAKRYPDKQFIGYDIAQSNIDKAREWAESEGLSNVKFIRWSVGEQCEDSLENHDLMVVCELLEHVNNPLDIINALQPYTKEFLCSTPLGPWEFIGYKEHWPWRAHLHHFERADITDLFGECNGFHISTVPSGHDKFGRSLGSYVFGFKPSNYGDINYTRKFETCYPRQTVSLCMLVKDAERTIETALLSCAEIVDEVVIGLDIATKDSTKERIESFCNTHKIPLKLFPVESPLSIGFDDARNAIIARACGSWVFWLDADEQVIHAQNVIKYLRINQFNGYAVRQNHITLEPAGVLKTDLPVKFFRNFKGIKFFGKVHEHPEIKMNEGVGHVYLIPDVSIGHYGYTDEETRRARFRRNIGLLKQDRELNPDRLLGKFLWLRDLAQMCGYDAETGTKVTHAEIIGRIEEGSKLFLELIDSGNCRLVLDALPYYSILSKITGNAIEAVVNFSIKKGEDVNLIKEHEVKGSYQSIDHYNAVYNMLMKEKQAEM